MKYLYSMSAEQQKALEQQDVAIESFSPRPGKLFLYGEQRSMKQAVLRLLFQIMTCGNAKIYYVKGADGAAVHTSYVIPKCFKFPFLGKDDCQIGPCYTAPEARGQGLYPCVLRHICWINKHTYTGFYMTVNSQNTSSIRGIEKAGFTRCGRVRESRILKRYYLE